METGEAQKVDRTWRHARAEGKEIYLAPTGAVDRQAPPHPGTLVLPPLKGSGYLEAATIYDGTTWQSTEINGHPKKEDQEDFPGRAGHAAPAFFQSCTVLPMSHQHFSSSEGARFGGPG
jgi:hypothetical protein